MTRLPSETSGPPWTRYSRSHLRNVTCNPTTRRAAMATIAPASWLLMAALT